MPTVTFPWLANSKYFVVDRMTQRMTLNMHIIGFRLLEKAWHSTVRNDFLALSFYIFSWNTNAPELGDMQNFQYFWYFNVRKLSRLWCHINLYKGREPKWLYIVAEKEARTKGTNITDSSIFFTGCIIRRTLPAPSARIIPRTHAALGK